LRHGAWGVANEQGNELASSETLDHRWDEFGEFRVRDRADRWLQAVERRQQEQQRTTIMSSGETRL